MTARSVWTGRSCLAAMTAACVSTVAFGSQRRADHTQEHRPHVLEATEGSLAIARVTRVPDHFVGNVIRDPESGRVWLLSFGPPANTAGPSMLYQLDPASGEVVARRRMPFLGEFGAAAYVDGLLYQAIPYESALYTIGATGDSMGTIIDRMNLPTHVDIKPADNDVYRFPSIAFTGAAPSDDGHLWLYASDLGEIITLDRKRGTVLRRVRTTKGLAGITRVSGVQGRSLLLGAFDPVDAAFRQESRRFMFRAAHGILPLETVRAEGNYGHAGQKTVTWALVDPETGEVLAVTSVESSRISVGSVAFVRREPVQGTRYGKLVALTTGDEGMLTVEWIPR